VVGIEEAGFIPDAIFPHHGGEPQTINGFLAQFVGCGEKLPAHSRELLGRIYRERLGVALSRQQLDTYAKAARRLRELRRGESGLRQRARRTRSGPVGGERG
jgi:hypothetical protein